MTQVGNAVCTDCRNTTFRVQMNVTGLGYPENPGIVHEVRDVRLTCTKCGLARVLNVKNWPVEPAPPEAVRGPYG